MGKSRLPAIIATVVALPVAVVAGVFAFQFMTATAEESEPEADLTPVSVEVPALEGEDAVICLALTATAPDTAGELPARPVEGGERASEFVLAYGDPAVVATCGAAAVEIEDTAPVFKLNGVCWFSEENGDGSSWVTLDRQVPVAVEFPAEFEQPSDVLNDLSTVIAEKVKAAETAPTGCA